jgi:hypothetical protein
VIWECSQLNKYQLRRIWYCLFQNPIGKVTKFV